MSMTIVFVILWLVDLLIIYMMLSSERFFTMCQEIFDAIKKAAKKGGKNVNRS